MLMAMFMKASGIMIKLKEKELMSILMVQSILGIGRRIDSMDTE